MKIENKIVLVSGANRGIGKSIVDELLKNGVEKVYAGARKISSLPNWNDDRVIALELDTTNDVQVQAAAKTAGDVDILINNAGLGTSKLLIEMEDEEWDKVINVTLNGTMRMTRYMMKVMKKRGSGVIVNNASVLGWRAQKEQTHYAAAKAGVMALTRCAALEAADFGVRINAVAPSIVLHPMLRKSASEELLAELEAREAYGRAAEAWEVANVMMFLASDYSSYMTGEILSCSSQRS